MKSSKYKAAILFQRYLDFNLNKRLSFIVFLVILTSFWSCNESQEIKELSSTTHTSLVYIIADNNLDPYPEEDIEEMMNGYQSVHGEGNNLIIYIDDRDAPRLLQIYKTNGIVRLKTIKEFEERNSLDIEVMGSTIAQIFMDYNADTYGLTLWSHGDGWLPAQNPNEVVTRAFGEDRNTGENYQLANLDIPDLKRALKNVPHLEYILFDACNMQGIEVAYELRDITDYIIGSPVEIPAYGAPYHEVVPAFFSINDKAQHIARSFFDTYDLNYDPQVNNGSKSKSSLSSKNNSQNHYRSGLAISVLDCNQLDLFADKFQEVITNNTISINPNIYFSYDSYYKGYYYDTKDFLMSLNDNKEEIENVFGKLIPLYLSTSGTYSSFENQGKGGQLNMSGSNGLSNFIPHQSSFINAIKWKDLENNSYSESLYMFYFEFYKNMDWYSVAGWENSAAL